MAPRRPVVLDASALLDALDERHPANAAALRDVQARHPCMAPALLAWELGNVVHRKQPDLFGPRDRREALLELLLEGVELAASDAATRARCAGLVEATGLTFYDAAYLDLALAQGLTLVTQDRRLAAAARQQGGQAASLEEAAKVAREARP